MKEKDTLSRRSFLQGATAGTIAIALAAHTAQDEPAAAQAPGAAAPVACGVVGTGQQGRAILAALARVQGASVAAICDTYDRALAAGQKVAPNAAALDNYKKLLDMKEVVAVFVATPSHLHRQIVLDALQAGKHVYCEAPLATTVDEARAIATAGKAAKTVFAVGQQQRANPLYRHARGFVSTGLKNIVQARAQWHRKAEWRFTAATPEAERERNWRLYKDTSPGLLGEVGLHQLDAINWYLRKPPQSVQGFGGVLHWQDGREVADTVQCLFEYPDNVRVLYDATLANSFDGTYELLMGTDAAILLREDRAWMFKEADAAPLGWEVYAHKERIGNMEGIALIADATKLLAQGKKPGEVGPGGEAGKDALYYSVESFLQCIREQKPAACGALEGLQAAVTALKANEAIVTGTRVAYQKEWFELA